MTDVVMDKLNAEIAEAAETVRAVLVRNTWTCSHCDQPFERPEWMTAVQIREQAAREWCSSRGLRSWEGPYSSIWSLAISSVRDAGDLEQDTRWRLRVRVADESAPEQHA